MTTTNAQAALLAAATAYSGEGAALDPIHVELLADRWKQWLDDHDARLRRTAQERHHAPPTGSIPVIPMVPGVQD